MLACARLGRGAQRRLRRVLPGRAQGPRSQDAEAKLLITSDGQYRRGKPAPMKENTDEAVAETPSIEHVLVVKRTETEVPWTEGRDVWWHELVDRQSDEHEPEAFDAEHPLFILYTSGTTGKPKGILHTSGGYLTQAAYTHHVVFDHKPGESVYWCTADIGWVTGHSYIVYGPLANRATSVMYEGTPNTPHEGRHWEIIQKYGVTIYYTAPTLIRTFMKWGKEIPEKYDLSSLRVLGSVGEPINPEAWMWYRENIGHDNCPIVDTWWQTETGAIMISPLPGVTATKPGSAMRPLPGIGADDGRRGRRAGRPRAAAATWCSTSRGRRCCAASGATRSATATPTGRRFADQGYYFAGDGAKYDDDGAIWLLGRVDDVMNVSGHRISTTEVESALVSHPTVAEAAVVGASDPTTGQGIVAFVILRGNVAYDEADERDACSRRCATTSPRRSARSPSRGRSWSSTSCPRPAPARSCAGCCGTSRRTARSATSRRWPTRR